VESGKVDSAIFWTENCPMSTVIGAEAPHRVTEGESPAPVDLEGEVRAAIGKRTRVATQVVIAGDQIILRGTYPSYADKADALNAVLPIANAHGRRINIDEMVVSGKGRQFDD
jgi:hypothetical protein